MAQWWLLCPGFMQQAMLANAQSRKCKTMQQNATELQNNENFWHESFN